MPYDKTRDKFPAALAQSVSAQGRGGRAITPSDTADLLVYAKALYINVAGNLTFIPVDNDDATALTVAVPVGIFNAYQVRRVLATGTTATGIFSIE